MIKIARNVFMTSILLLSLVACNKDINTTNDNPAEIEITEDKPSKETNQQIAQEDMKTIDPSDEAKETNSNPAKEVTPLPNVDTPVEPIILTSPPIEYYNSIQATKSTTIPLNLKLSQSTPNNIIDDEDWFLDNNLELKSYYIEDAFQRGEADLPGEIETTQSDLFLTSAFFDDSYLYAVYGTDYNEGYLLNIYDVYTNSKLYSLDFTNYRYAPEFVTEDYGYVQQKVNWAVLQDNILYVSNSHNTYAKSSKYRNGYITAIDLISNSIIWRSKPLVSNTKNFQILDNVIICGYGFTAEDDFLYELDKNTGLILNEIPLKSAPTYIIKKDNLLYVRTYDTDYEFIIEE